MSGTRQSGFCIILAACAAFSFYPAQRDAKSHLHDGFGPALQRALHSSLDRFRELEGARIENRKRDYFFESKIYLPEAKYCRIFNHRGWTVFCCEWRDRGYSSSKARYQNLIGNTESALGPEWTKNLKAGKRQEALFTAEGKPTVQVMLDSEPLETYVLILPPNGSKGGFVGRIPTMEEFVHP